MKPWGLCLLLVGCGAYPSVETERQVPSPGRFVIVSSLIEPHCGTSDCHGDPARNLRIYGRNGLRASGNDVTGGNDTTLEEIGLTYQSLISLQPELIERLVNAAGRESDWIVLSKSRGAEAHVGGAPLPEGSVGDECLVSWVRGVLDEAVCNSDVFGPVPREGETW